MTVELSALPWPAAIVAADGQLHECNARWETRFGSCDDLEREFPEAAQKLREVVEKRAPPGALVRAPGEIAPLHLSYTALNATESLWLIIVEGRAVEVRRRRPRKAPRCAMSNWRWTAWLCVCRRATGARFFTIPLLPKR